MAQLLDYVEQLKPECPGGGLIAERVPGTVERYDEVSFLEADFGKLDLGNPQPYERMSGAIELKPVER